MAYLRQAMSGAAPIAGRSGVAVTILAFYPVASVAKRDRGQLKATARSDLDNVAKLVLDACVKARVIVDDRHVSRLHCERRHAEAPGRERVEVMVTT